MKNKLKSVLVGNEFKEEDYTKELNSILKDFNVEANTCDFDYDRLYNVGYEERADWSTEYIASIETQFITKGEEENEEDFIKIIDVF